MKKLYTYTMDGIYGRVSFIHDTLLETDNENKFASTTIETFEVDDYYEDFKTSSNHGRYGSRYNIQELPIQYGLPIGITMEMYFNMVMSRKDFNYGEIQNLKKQISQFDDKLQKQKDSFASDLYYAKHHRR